MRPLTNYQVNSTDRQDSFCEAPLSWVVSPASGDKLESISLFGGKEFIYQATISSELLSPDLANLLLSKCGKGFVIKGASKSLAREVSLAGGEALCLGYCADLDLKEFAPSPSLAELIRRGGRNLNVQEISFNEAQTVIAGLRKEVKYAKQAKLRYLFREPCRSQRYFLAERSEPAGRHDALVSISGRGGMHWHTELILRSHKAPAGCMEYLFSEIISKLQKEQVQGLSLGEVPFISLKESHSPSTKLELVCYFAPRVFKLLSPAYNVDGLYRFKDKFNPTWKPVYWSGWPSLDIKDFLAVGYFSGALGLR